MRKEKGRKEGREGGREGRKEGARKEKEIDLEAAYTFLEF